MKFLPKKEIDVAVVIICVKVGKKTGVIHFAQDCAVSFLLTLLSKLTL